MEKTRDEKELSKMTNVDKKTIAAVLDRLYDEDYIGENSMVTEKGFDLLNQPSTIPRTEEGTGLSALELLLLKNVGPRMKDKELSEMAKVDLTTVSAKLDKLYDEDLISENHMLTERGFNILHQQAPEEVEKPTNLEPLAETGHSRQPNETTRTVVIQREVVRVPCKYCGNLIDLATVTTCPKCGAAIR